MRALSATELLHVWEEVGPGHTAERALHLLSVASADPDYARLSALTIGQRDAQLLRLRQRTFGNTLQAQTVCPQCGERLEFTVLATDLLAPCADAGCVAPAWHDFSVGDWRVRFRLPDSSDMLAIAGDGDVIDQRDRLLVRCVAEVTQAGRRVEVNALPEEIIGEMTTRMESLDPCADINLTLSCPACETGWDAQFDILGYLWAEVSVYAQRLLREVNVLARVYGWREADILALSSRRRRAYLDMCGA
jgi:hypothetical protein